MGVQVNGYSSVAATTGLASASCLRRLLPNPAVGITSEEEEEEEDGMTPGCAMVSVTAAKWREEICPLYVHDPQLFSSSSPNHQWWYAKWELSRNLYALHTRFLHIWRRFVCSVGAFTTKISASELSRKFIESALLVGSSLLLSPSPFFSRLCFCASVFPFCPS